jgi:hypothetical protein
MPLPRYRGRVPAYDRVLGSHLDLAGVEDAARVEVKRLFFAAIANDADLSAADRLQQLHQLAQVPGIRIALACEGEGLERYLVIAHDGEVRTVILVDSRAADVVESPAGAIRPEVLVTGSIEGVLRRIEQGGAIDPVYDLGDQAIELPFLWRARGEMIRAIAEIAPQLAQAVAFLVQIDDRRYDIVIEHGRLHCIPLHLVGLDAGPGHGAAFFELARLPLPTAADRTELVLRHRPLQTIAAPPMRDPSRPYTTGTLEQRRASIAAATAAKTRDFGRLVSALQDPANAEPRYDQVRRDLYRYLAGHDTREIAGLFLWALQEESEALMETVTLLAWRQSALLAALPDLAEAAETRGDKRTAQRMRAALGEARR